MAKIAAIHFTQEVLRDGSLAVHVQCPRCGERASIYTDHTNVPLCVENEDVCPFKINRFFPLLPCDFE